MAPMPSCPLLERATHPRKVPNIFLGSEAPPRILWPQNPRIVGQTALGRCAHVSIDELPCRRHSNHSGLKSEVLWIPDKIKQVRVAAAELLLAVYPKRV